MKPKIKIAYLTSCRELGLAGGEQIGRVVSDKETGATYGYRTGCLEQLAKLLWIEHDAFSRRCSIEAVICDDSDQEEEREWQAAVLWPRDRRLPNGRSLEDITYRVPSTWRKIPENQVGERRVAKNSYESKILDILQEHRIDLIVVDSYHCIIGPTLLQVYSGRILNIHPALIKGKYQTRGAHPTRDAFTRAKYGYIINDDKKIAGLAKGKPQEVRYQGRSRQAVALPKVNITGVTVHVVTPELDAGPVVASRQYTFDPRDCSEESIRTHNYRLKHQLLPAAIVDYVADHPRLFSRPRAMAAS